MSETYPHFESDSHDDRGEKSPKRERPVGKIERPIGRMVTPLERRVPLRPLGELYPIESRKAEAPAAGQKPEAGEPRRHEQAELPNWRKPDAAELAAMAEQAHRMQFEESGLERTGKSDEGKDAKAKPANEKVEADTARDSRHSLEPADMPTGVRTRDENLGDEPLGPEVERNPHQPLETDSEFHGIVDQPELVDLAARHVPGAPRLPVEEQAKPEAFDRWVRQSHPELGTPEMAAAANQDEGFNDIVRHNYGDSAPAGPTRYHEQAPGEPPIDAGHGGANIPPIPPTAEGGAWGGRNAWEQPAGGLAGPVALAGVSALEARRHIDNLRHTAAELTLAGGEAALAGAVGILGLALAAEHIRAKHREKKLSRQLHRQDEALTRTNQDLASEQAGHLRTREQLDQLSTHEQRGSIPERKLPVAEVAVGAGLISAAAAAELAAKTGQQVEKPQTISDQELASRLKHSRELGRAIQRNPEIRNAAENNAHTLGEIVGASAYADTLKRERNYERLQTEPVDNTGQPRSAGGADTAGASVASGLPRPGGPVLPSPQSANELINQTSNRSARPNYTKHVAAATVLVVVVLILIFIFAR